MQKRIIMSEETKVEIAQATLEAIGLLRNIVKYSNIDNQKHLDMTLISSEKRGAYEKALIIVNAAMNQGQLTQDELNSKLGLK